MEKKIDPEDGLRISYNLKQPGTGVSSATAKLQLRRYFSTSSCKYFCGPVILLAGNY